MSMFNGNNDNNSYNSGSNTFSGSQIGGGFVSNDSGMGGDGGGKSQQRVIPYDERKLSQVTIKQILTAPAPQPDEALFIDGQEISQLQMVAQIQSIDCQSSHTSYRINDMTGSLDAKQWSNDNQVTDTSGLGQGAWVRIFGRINVYQGRCSINVFEIAPITDFNDITLHFTECIYSHLANTTATEKGPSQPQQQQQQNQGGWNGQQQQQQQQNQGGGWNQNQNQNQQPRHGGNGNGNGGAGDSLQNKILNIIRSPEFENSETGCDVSVLFSRLGNEDVNAIRAAIDQLSDSGMIYSTVDDEHYKFSGDGN